MTTVTIVHIKDCTCCESVIKTAKKLEKEIDPITQDAPVVLKSCKIYRTEEGMKMIPTKKMIKEAIRNVLKQPQIISGCCG